LRISEDKNDPSWDEFLGKIKQMISASFEQIVANYEDEARKSDARRMKKGWSYCEFFLLKV
jgi:hypothetical protein